MKTLIFGLGKKYNDLKTYIEGLDVIAFLDNNREKENSVFEGKAVYHPARIPKEIQYDAVLLMSTYYFPMKRQLLELGIERSKLYSLFQIGELHPLTISRREMETIRVWTKSAKRFLLIQHDGGGGGATIALMNLALALSKQYSVLVTFPTRGETASFYEKNNIPYVCNIQMNCDTKIFGSIISAADRVLVNAVINNSILKLLHDKNKPFYLWLHDHPATYERSDCELIKMSLGKGINVLAVSHKAMNAFSSYVKPMPYMLFPLAIQSYGYYGRCREKSAIPVIAVIGDICSIKGQDILLDALELVRDCYRLKLIGGKGTEYGYTSQVIARCQKKETYEYTGKMANEELHKLYLEGEIDILICPSRFETMSIACIEAMSYGIPVIASDMTGIADYIREKEPGCVFQSEDSHSLAGKIEWLISSRETRRVVGEKMKDIYETNFSIKELEKRCGIFDRQES